MSCHRKAQIACLVALLLACSFQSYGRAAPIRWHRALQQASAVALKADKPIMIEFWADWCEPCKVMETEVYANPQVAALVETTVVPLRINFDNEKQLVGRYNVEAIPYLIFANSYGTELLHHRGILGAKDLSAIIQALPSDVSQINRIDRVLQKDRGNVEALNSMAARLREANLFQVSNQFYEKALKTDGVKKNPNLKETILREMGLNFLDLQDGKGAASSFERCLKEFPNGDSHAACQAGLRGAYALTGRKID